MKKNYTNKIFLIKKLHLVSNFHKNWTVNKRKAETWVAPLNQLARELNTKVSGARRWGPRSGMWRRSPHESGSLGELIRPNIKLFLNSSKFPMHYECLVQSRPNLRNKRKNIWTKKSVWEHYASVRTIFFWRFKEFWTTISQQL